MVLPHKRNENKLHRCIACIVTSVCIYIISTWNEHGWGFFDRRPAGQPTLSSTSLVNPPLFCRTLTF